jgi:hypothetical protein
MLFFSLSAQIPKKLFLQMDNCWRENKNRFVLAFCDRLVALGVFESVQLSFLPVGHTHEGRDSSQKKKRTKVFMACVQI